MMSRLLQTNIGDPEEFVVNNFDCKLMFDIKRKS